MTLVPLNRATIFPTLIGASLLADTLPSATPRRTPTGWAIRIHRAWLRL